MTYYGIATNLVEYPTTLAISALIILFSEMLKFSQIFLKENIECSRIFYLSK
jgi:hypothetical protein